VLTVPSFSHYAVCPPPGSVPLGASVLMPMAFAPTFPTFSPSLPVVSITKENENPGKQLKQTRRTQRQEPALFIGAYSPDCESPNCEFDEAVD